MLMAPYSREAEVAAGAAPSHGTQAVMTPGAQYCTEIGQRKVLHLPGR